MQDLEAKELFLSHVVVLRDLVTWITWWQRTRKPFRFRENTTAMKIARPR